MNENDLRKLTEDKILYLVETSAENTLKGFSEKAWDTPLTAFSSGADPLYNSYKTIVGEKFWTPVEIMQKTFPHDTFNEDHLTVISWILPQTEATLSDQRQETELPSSRWVHSRHYGEFFNEFLRREIRDMYLSMGIKACAPALSPDFAYQESETTGKYSNWSERHVAYAAGLGTFSLSDGFITEKGMAARIGSVVIDTYITPDKREYTNHLGNCLYYAKGTCGACIKRCPAGAITREGHDKQKCFDYIRGVTGPHAQKLLGTFQTPCGLCQVRVPCEKHNPMAQR
ncbi:4Fe-4S ferredoxin, iron-sulfur binding protein [Denitrovibrio acetiphilus DSM 12809]|uniref:4Fe-4S ferredoxin, iron-sulfur binding protein n=1 Tax=Denitrovibrio acetiphilus (strain DSM 12809 / NBRC 114555 / N2460) TaxID=522772 RepID=D4H0S3_DENA2|nr:4Fe-4S ferredoxin [Denitrovibrio acetiphilus]ADD68586.1 4Fe-4S ferredoxin, iron-sulfur binding protein [Denitrovibrio acetiphilus DSM 12809]